MPQVPYDGVQRVAPNLEPTPRYQANVDPAAFGVNVAQAVQDLGKAVDGAGSEIFQRGLAMQDLYNHSEAQQADADYMMKAGELHANYSSLQGKAAVDAYPQYMKDLQDARSKIRDGLSNPMSQKLYDSSSLSTMGRTIFNGAGHAATQNKQYAVASSSARVQAMGDQALANPTDDALFQTNLLKAQQEVQNQTQLQAGAGPDDPITKEAVAQKTSELWSQRIKGLAKQQPIAAGKMLDAAVKSGAVQGEDIAKLTNLVQQQRNTVGARMVSAQVSSGATDRWGAGQVDIRQAGEAIASVESGGRYDLIGVDTAHGRALGKYQIMEEFLPEYLARAGLPSMTPKEFLDNHAAQDQTFAANFGGLMKKYGSANDAASAWLTGKPLAEAGNVKDALGTDAKTYVARFNAALAKGAPLSAKVAMGTSIANEQAPSDPLFPDYVQQRITADHNLQLSVKRDDEFNNRQTVETALMGQEGGKLPTTVEELGLQAREAWDRLLPQTQRRYMNVMAQNAKGDHNWTDESLRTYQQFKGQAATDPASFIDEDVIGSSLPNSAKRELINLQERTKKNASGDPRVARALSILAPDMQAAGIDKKNKEDYYQFVGALSDELQRTADENKKPPSVEEVRTIGSRLMQSQRVPGRLWGTNDVPTYRIPVPKEEAETIRADPKWAQLGIVPSDTQVQRIFMAKKYQDLYGGTPKAQAGAKPPQVPRAQ